MGRDGLKWFGVYLLLSDFLSLLLLRGRLGPLMFNFGQHQGGEKKYANNQRGMLL